MRTAWWPSIPFSELLFAQRKAYLAKLKCALLAMREEVDRDLLHWCCFVPMYIAFSSERRNGCNAFAQE